MKCRSFLYSVFSQFLLVIRSGMRSRARFGCHLTGCLGKQVPIAQITILASLLWLWGQTPAALAAPPNSTLDSTATAAIFVPQQAPAMASLLVNPERLTELRQESARSGERQQIREEFLQLQQGVLGASGLDYDRDVKPWLGSEVTVAMTSLDLDRDASNGQQPGYLLALTSQDSQRSREFLQLFWQKRAVKPSDLTFEQYKGTQIIYGQPTPPTSEPSAADPTLTLASAVVGDRFVLFANSPKVLRDSINNAQAAELNLVSSPTYQRAIGSLTTGSIWKTGRIGTAFFNPAVLSGLTPSTTPEIPKSAADRRQLSTRVAIALGFNSQGLIAETAFLPSAKIDPIAQSITPSTATSTTTNVSDSQANPKGNPALKYIPAHSPIVLSGQDLHQFWTQLTQPTAQPESPALIQQLFRPAIAALQSQTHLNLSADALTWAKGHYTIALVPQTAVTRKGNPQPPTWEWVMITDRPAETGAIAPLETWAKTQGLTSQSLPLGKQPVQIWSTAVQPDIKPTAKSTVKSTVKSTEKTATIAEKTATVNATVKGVHTTLGQSEVLTPSTAVMNQILSLAKNNLANDTGFQRSLSALSNKQGYLYIDWKTAQPLLEQQFPMLKLAEFAGQPLFGYLQSLTIAPADQSSPLQQAGIFLRLS